MGNYALGYGPRQKADMVGSVLSMVSLQNVFSNSGAVKLGRSGYCICANLRFFWDAFKMGRILEKWHISNTKASSWARSCLLQGTGAHHLLKIVLPNVFFYCKISSSIDTFLERTELFSGTQNKERYQAKNIILCQVLAVKIPCWNAKG